MTLTDFILEFAIFKISYITSYSIIKLGCVINILEFVYQFCMILYTFEYKIVLQVVKIISTFFSIGVILKTFCINPRWVQI